MKTLTKATTKTKILLGFFKWWVGNPWELWKISKTRTLREGYSLTNWEIFLTFWPIKREISFRFNWHQMFVQIKVTFPLEHMILFTLYDSQMIMALVNHWSTWEFFQISWISSYFSATILQELKLYQTQHIDSAAEHSYFVSFSFKQVHGKLRMRSERTE